MKHILILTFSAFILFSCGNEKEINTDNNSVADRLLEDIDTNEMDVPKVISVNTLKEISKEIVEKEVESEKETPKEVEKIAIVKEDIKKSSETNTVVEKEKTNPVIVPTQIVEENHKEFDALLQKYVSSSGKVNYSGFKKDQQRLKEYIKEMQLLYKDLKVWNKAKRLAYWINVYNANTINLILDNYPTTSITKLKGGKPWDFKIIDLGGKIYTLNDIENKIIRPRFKEPRIHFAVNCAAKSCPKLLNKAWTEHNLYRYLTKQTKAFLANTKENTITAEKVSLSKIFEWYKADFGGDNAKLINFINKYSSTRVNENATVEFKEYDWDLNN